ncbi:MAG: phenylalanine--tRNA ligase subunit beta [Puniceicoccales bacterium]|jgi:phenylalanyl-tRNA synthetase beta chain|nr:phenylalanine--tRNA ligase subunit beta [Puniceicoccales bacterium]
MKLGLNWLKRYVDVDVDVAALSDIFTSLGFEVEGIEYIGLQRQSTLIVGEIQEIRQHPNADKLALCRVCVGRNDVRQIVCGAKNFKVSDHVPVALPGTILPGDVKIESSTLRGVKSDGMMCSGRELGIGNDHSGLLILDSASPIGANLHDVLNTESDVIFDLGVTSNRGDCLSYVGMARELASKLGKILKLPTFKVPEIFHRAECIAAVSVESEDCSCYHAFCVRGVKIGPSPDWLVSDLKASGMKSINNVVDICNWVMLEIGNPMHAFDLKKIADLRLNIRRARDGESLLGLDGKVHEMNQDVTVIADGNRPLVIAGIMGSIDAKIDDSTTDILLESACFESAAIMHSSRALGISTDSSYRFARSVDACTCEEAGNRAVALILELCGGEYVQRNVAKSYNHAPQTLKVEHDFIARRLGFEIDCERIIQILSTLGFGVEFSGGFYDLAVPSHRRDVTLPIDIVEECLRVYGTDKIPESPVKLTSVRRDDARPYTFCTKTRQLLANHGFLECYNYSLADVTLLETLCGEGSCIKLRNPLLSDQNCYRESLIPGLLSTLRSNIQNGNFDDQFFEIGKIAVKVSGEFNECLAVSLIALEDSLDRAVASTRHVDFFHTKKLCFDVLANILDTKQIDLRPISESKIWQPEHSAEYCQLARSGVGVRCGLLNKKTLKNFFDLKGNIFAAEMTIADSVFERKVAKHNYKPFSQFPRVSKDISVVVAKDEQVNDVQRVLEKCIKKSLVPNVEMEYVKLFDIYSGERIDSDKKALGFEIGFRSNERTLTDSEVQYLFDSSQRELEKFYEIRKVS